MTEIAGWVSPKYAQYLLDGIFCILRFVGQLPCIVQQLGTEWKNGYFEFFEFHLHR